MALHVVTGECGRAVVGWTRNRSGQRIAGWERPERIAAIRAGLEDGGACFHSCSKAADDLGRDAIHQVHDHSYLRHLRDRSSPCRGPRPSVGADFAAPGLAQDTPIVIDTWELATAAATVAVSAALTAADEGVTTYALCRPPGHHAGPRWSGGYCYLNNAAVAARILRTGGMATLAIIDVDYHLGNGTLACVEALDGVSYFSVHSARPTDFPYDFPMLPGLVGLTDKPSLDEYGAVLADLLDQVRRVGPDGAIVSVGYDILDGDPHGSWDLPPSIFFTVGRLVNGLDVPTVFVQEGGYHVSMVHAAAKALAEGLAHD